MTEASFPVRDIVTLLARHPGKVEATVSLYPQRPGEDLGVQVNARSEAGQALRTPIRVALTGAAVRLADGLHPLSCYTAVFRVAKAKGEVLRRAAQALIADNASVASPDPGALAAACAALAHRAWPGDLNSDLDIDIRLTFNPQILFHTPTPAQPEIDTGHIRVVIDTVRITVTAVNPTSSIPIDPSGALLARLHAACYTWFATAPAWFTGMTELAFALTVPPPSAHDRAALARAAHTILSDGS